MARKRRKSGGKDESRKEPAGESSQVAPLPAPDGPATGLSQRRIWIAAAIAAIIVAVAGFGFQLRNGSESRSCPDSYPMREEQPP